MKDYLTTLIEEKGRSTQTEINLKGHIGLTYQMLIDYIEEAKEYHQTIKTTLVKIDFLNGDIFHYLDFLAVGMVKALGYEIAQ
jgi:uncharacterized protein YueI